MREAGLVQPALCRLQHPDVGVQHESEVGVGGDREIDGSRARCVGRGAAVHAGTSSARRRQGSAPGRAIEHVHHLAPHEHRRVREQVVLRQPQHLRGVERRAVDAVAACVLAAQPIGDDVADRLAARGSEASDTARRTRGPCGRPGCTTNESHTIWSSTSRPRRGLGTRVVLVRDARAGPRCAASRGCRRSSRASRGGCLARGTSRRTRRRRPSSCTGTGVVRRDRAAERRRAAAHAASAGTPSR